MTITHSPASAERDAALSSLNALHIRRVFGRDALQAPEPYGQHGWQFFEAHAGCPRVRVTLVEHPDAPGIAWVKASISRAERTPDYDDLALLHRAVFAGRPAYQVFTGEQGPDLAHRRVLHLIGRADGTPLLPAGIIDLTPGRCTGTTHPRE